MYEPSGTISLNKYAFISSFSSLAGEAHIAVLKFDNDLDTDHDGMTTSLMTLPANEIVYLAQPNLFEYISLYLITAPDYPNIIINAYYDDNFFIFNYDGATLE